MASKFVWYEVMTSDQKAGTEFYTRVVGWNAQDMPMPGMTYTLLKVGDAQVAGLMKMPGEAGAAPPFWLGYISCDDVDAAAQKVVSLGGAIYRAPDDIPNVGRFAVVADPQGAAFALFKAARADDSAPAADAPGYPGWRELYAVDGATAFDFYGAMFGWTKGHGMDMGAMGVYQIFEYDGAQRGGMMTKPAEMPRPAWLYYFNVDAIDAAAQRVRDAGGNVMNGPMEVPGGQWIVQCADPQGAMFALVAPKR